VNDVIVLNYHALTEHWPASLSVTPSRFEAQLRLLIERGYRGATIHAAIHAPPAPKTLAVTFDDAYRSVFELALPILSRLGLPATVFVPTDFPGTEAPMTWPGIDGWLHGPYRSELMPMAWEQLGVLLAAGWEVGSHTCSHPRLTALDDAALAAELSESRGRCEQQLGVACRSLAYPYGDHDDRVVEATRVAGYEAALTVPDSLRALDPLRWPRIGVYHHENAVTFRAKISPTLRRARCTWAGERAVSWFRWARRA
jgi:peptidoglycan/xylan/chitin deacetylase (PgdA/CDA1 family)